MQVPTGTPPSGELPFKTLQLNPTGHEAVVQSTLQRLVVPLARQRSVASSAMQS